MIVRPLTNEELDAVNSALDYCKKTLGIDKALAISDIQSLYDYALNKDDVPVELTISIGLGFGSELIRRNPHIDWVRLSDDWGEETSLCYSDALIVCSPISMIQKRLNRSENVSLSQLASETFKSMNDMYVSGDYKPL